MLIGNLAQQLASKGCTLTAQRLQTIPSHLSFLPRSLVNVKGKEGSWLKLTALTLKSLIYNICDLFDERLQQQTIAAAGAISQRYLAKCRH